jgi:hypothetical protein
LSGLFTTEDKSGIFDGELDAVDINGISVAYNKDDNAIYVILQDGRVVGIEQYGNEHEITVYKNHPDSSSPYMEQVIVMENSINYYGEYFAYHDYGYSNFHN